MSQTGTPSIIIAENASRSFYRHSDNEFGNIAQPLQGAIPQIRFGDMKIDVQPDLVISSGSLVNTPVKSSEVYAIVGGYWIVNIGFTASACMIQPEK